MKSKQFAWPIAVLLVAMMPAARLIMIQGWLRPILVSGPSMSPTLWPSSMCIDCSGCRIRLRYLLRSDKRPTSIQCFNCGTAVPLLSPRKRSADRVLIDRGAYLSQNPKRYDLVAIESVDGQLVVKRVLGKPGEKIAFANGDLIVNGTKHSRSVDEVLEGAIDVHDDRFRTNARSRWNPLGNGWTQTKHGFTSVSSASVDQWLVYHHEMAYQDNKPGQIRDDYPGNLGISRVMVPAADLILTFKCQAESDFAINVAIACGGSAEDRVQHQFFVRGKPGARLTLAHVDGQVFAGKNGDVEKVTKKTIETDAPVDLRRPFAIKCSKDVSVQLSDLIVKRDIVWWQRPSNVGTGKKHHVRQLDINEYFVVGDNVPMSLDSRQQQSGPLRHQIVGRVYLYPFPRD